MNTERSKCIYLYGVRITGLTKDLKKSGVRHKEKSREKETFLLQITCQRFLTDLQLLQQVGQQL